MSSHGPKLSPNWRSSWSEVVFAARYLLPRPLVRRCTYCSKGALGRGRALCEFFSNMSKHMAPSEGSSRASSFGSPVDDRFINQGENSYCTYVTRRSVKSFFAP